MIVKKAYEYTLDSQISYSLIDNVEKTDVGYDEKHNRNFVNVYIKNRKDQNEFSTIYVEDITVYICNDQGKTLSIIRPINISKDLK